MSRPNSHFETNTANRLNQAWFRGMPPLAVSIGAIGEVRATGFVAYESGRAPPMGCSHLFAATISVILKLIPYSDGAC